VPAGVLQFFARSLKPRPHHIIMCDCENPETPECIAECAAQDITTSTFMQAIGDKKPVLIAFLVIAMIALLNWIVYAASGQELIGMATASVLPGQDEMRAKLNKAVLGAIGVSGLVLGIMAASA